MKILLPILILWFALPALAQQRAPMITVTNIAELVALNPNQYARGVPARLTVRVLGYHTPGDGGEGDFDWEISATATNLGTVFNSSVVAGGQWHRLNWNGDVRAFGAKGDDSTDNIVHLESALSVNNKILIPEGIFRLSRPLILAGSSFDIKGRGADFSVLKGTTATNIIGITNSFLGWGIIEDIFFDYDQAYTNSTANHIEWLGSGNPSDPNDYWNTFYKRLRFRNGYKAFNLRDNASVWGSTWKELATVGTTMSGGFMDLLAANTGGMPNNLIQSIYVRGDSMSGNVFELQNQVELTFQNVEINRFTNGVSALYMVSCYEPLVQNFRLEVSHFDNDFIGAIRMGSVINARFDGIYFQTCIFRAPTWNYVFQTFDASFAATVPIQLQRVQFRDCTLTSGDMALVASPNRLWYVDGLFSNNTVPPRLVYPFDATTNNVVRTWPQPLVESGGTVSKTLTTTSSRLQRFTDTLSSNIVVTLPDSTAGVNSGLEFNFVTDEIGDAYKVTVRDSSLSMQIDLAPKQWAAFGYYINKWECIGAGDRDNEFTRKTVTSATPFLRAYRQDATTTHEKALAYGGVSSYVNGGLNVWISNTNDLTSQGIRFAARGYTNANPRLGILETVVTETDSEINFGGASGQMAPKRIEFHIGDNAHTDAKTQVITIQKPNAANTTGLYLYNTIDSTSKQVGITNINGAATLYLIGVAP